MNIYGERAMRHWWDWLPAQYEAIDDPATFFAELGVWLSDEVARIEFGLLPPEYYSDDDFMTRVGHRGMARLRAEELVLRCAIPAPVLTDVDDELPTTWDAIFEASVIDVEDVVLPRRPRQAARRDGHVAFDNDGDLDAALDHVYGASARLGRARLLPRAMPARRRAPLRHPTGTAGPEDVAAPTAFEQFRPRGQRGLRADRAAAGSAL